MSRIYELSLDKRHEWPAEIKEAYDALTPKTQYRIMREYIDNRDATFFMWRDKGKSWRLES